MRKRAFRWVVTIAVLCMSAFLLACPMGRLRLLTSSEQVFNDKLEYYCSSRETTSFRSTTSNVRTDKLALRTELCARRHKTL